MTTPKNPEEIITELHNFRFSTPIGGGTYVGLCCPECKNEQFVCKECLTPWLRSSMASLLLWTSEQIKLPCEDEVFYDKDGNSFESPRTLLTNEAKKICSL